jgi:hypothetical protein
MLKPLSWDVLGHPGGAPLARHRGGPLPRRAGAVVLVALGSRRVGSQNRAPQIPMFNRLTCFVSFVLPILKKRKL